MCGRYALGVATEQIVAKFDVTAILLDLAGGVEELRPTNFIPVITEDDDGHRQLESMRWGLVPRWSREITGRPLINARAETLSEKPSFRDLFRRKRCLIPADGFYEWSDKKNSEGKQDMYFFTLGDRDLYGFAGVYDEWHDPSTDELVRSTCIITCEPNKLVGAVHHRMPVILTDETKEYWLSGEFSPGLSSVLQPYPVDGMKAELCVTAPISKAIKTKNLEISSETLSLF